MAVCPSSSGRDIKTRSKRVLCQRFRYSHATNLESRHKQPNPVHGKKHPQQRAVLFINHYAASGSQEVHRPNRSIVGSHVQRVIRHNKRMNAEFRLRPAVLGDIRSGYLFGEVGVDERPHALDRWSLHSKDDRRIASNLAATPRHHSTHELLGKGDSPTHAEDKIVLARLRSLSPRERGPATDIGGSVATDEDSGSSIAGTVMRYCES